jgi:hypothetical protein
MSEIPEDIMAEAEGIAALIPSRVANVNRTFAAQVIARATLAERERATNAERERCAQIAEVWNTVDEDDFLEPEFNSGRRVTSQSISTAIRTPSKPKRADT